MKAIFKILLEPKDIEILLWSLAEIADIPDRQPVSDGDPLAVLLRAGHERDDIGEACRTMEASVSDGFVIEPRRALDSDILRVSVENSSWLSPYREFGGGSAGLEFEKDALRRLARKLERMGVEINHIPC